jgi:cation diffusion facilitator family transporter
MKDKNPALQEITVPGESHGESKTAVIAAIIGNLAVAAVKFFAAAVTGSSAMISEGIHSLVDTGNGGLLFLGIQRSDKPADRTHPFGYGKELYFWSLIVAISIFGIGGGMSIYEGIVHIQHPSPLESPTISYIVLGLAFVFEGISWMVAWKQFRLARGTRRTWPAIKHGKDPGIFMVVFEDSAALAGLVVAFLGVFLGHTFDNPYFDGGASVLIGLLLATVAVWLAYKSRELLVGESASPEVVRAITAVAEADQAVVRAGPALTMYLGPREVLLNLSVEFLPGLPAEEVHRSIHRMEQGITALYPEITRIYIEVESLTMQAETPPGPLSP